jgi:hypothetical protein
MASNIDDITNEITAFENDSLIYFAQSDGLGGFLDAKIKSSTANLEWRKFLIQSVSVSNDATIEFVSVFEGFNYHVLEFINVVPQTNNVRFDLEISEDAGATWLGGANYANNIFAYESNSTALNVFQDITSTPILLTSNTTAYKVGNGATEGLCGTVEIFSLNDNVDTFVKTNTNHIYNSNAVVTYGVSKLDNNAVADGLRLSFDSGNMASGEIRLYGVKI